MRCPGKHYSREETQQRERTEAKCQEAAGVQMRQRWRRARNAVCLWPTRRKCPACSPIEMTSSGLGSMISLHVSSGETDNQGKANAGPLFPQMSSQKAFSILRPISRQPRRRKDFLHFRFNLLTFSASKVQ